MGGGFRVKEEGLEYEERHGWRVWGEGEGWGHKGKERGWSWGGGNGVNMRYEGKEGGMQKRKG